jgi:hypothetical protein
MVAVLDHFAIGTPALADGWDLFGGVLGGTWAYGGDSPGYWWGQLEFAAGPKIELLAPTGGPDAAFLERFLVARGAGPHHFNFLVTDIESTRRRRVQRPGLRARRPAGQAPRPDRGTGGREAGPGQPLRPQWVARPPMTSMRAGPHGVPGGQEPSCTW